MMLALQQTYWALPLPATCIAILREAIYLRTSSSLKWSNNNFKADGKPNCTIGKRATAAKLTCSPKKTGNTPLPKSNQLRPSTTLFSITFRIFKNNLTILAMRVLS